MLTNSFPSGLNRRDEESTSNGNVPPCRGAPVEASHVLKRPPPAVAAYSLDSLPSKALPNATAISPAPCFRAKSSSPDSVSRTPKSGSSCAMELSDLSRFPQRVISLEPVDFTAIRLAAVAGTASRGSVRNSFVRPISQMRTALSSPAVANREASGLTERLVTLPSCALRLMVDAVAAFQTTTPPSRPPSARSLLEPYARLVLPPGEPGRHAYGSST